MALVSVRTSATPRGARGTTVYDPLSTGSPFAYLSAGAGIGEYTTLSAIVHADNNRVQVAADVFFDAGTELPFDDDAYMSLALASEPLSSRAFVCGATRREGDYVSLACRPGQSIVNILFASLGNPTMMGCEPGEYAYGSCNSETLFSAVSSACIGQASCTHRFSSSAFPACSFSLIEVPTLAIVAECSGSAPQPSLFARSVATVGAYSQSGWTRVTATIDAPGTYRLTFGVRNVGVNDPARVSALAVDNVLVCLLPTSGLSSSPPPTSASPVPTPALVADELQLAFIDAGALHTCGVTPLNRLLCWGGNVRVWDTGAADGQATVPPALTFASVATVSAGDAHTCAVLTSGGVRCFGGNWAGQSSVPTPLYDGSVPAVAVAAGHDFTCATTTAGEVQCWGNGWNIGVVPGIVSRGALAVAAGFQSACAVTQYRTVVCWGAISQPPASVAAGGVQWLTMSGWPNNVACAATSGGVVCWGDFGVFTSDLRSSAVAVLGEARGVRVLGARGVVTTDAGGTAGFQRVALACGYRHCCYQFAGNGTLTCVGDNARGQLTPPMLQPFATPLPRSYPPSLGAAAPCSAAVGASPAEPALDCSDYYLRACDTTEGVRWIQSSAGAAYEAVCHEGYALAMKLSGGGGVFTYASGFWTNETLHNPAPSAVWAASDAKLAPFTRQRLSTIRLRNRAVNTSVDVGVVSQGATHASLAALFAALNGTEVRSWQSKAGWLAIAPGAAVQGGCNRGGLNLFLPWGYTARIGFFMDDYDDCGSPDAFYMVGVTGGSNVLFAGATPSLEIYVRGPFDSAAPTATPSPSPSLSPGASPSTTPTVAGSASAQSTPSASRPPTPTRTGSPPASGTPTGTHTLRASASASDTAPATATSSATPSVSPYCGVGEYQYFPGFDVEGNATLGVAAAGTERDCARACCDVPACDGYAFSFNDAPAASAANCFFAANVTGIARNRLLNSGVRTRVL